MNVRRTSFACAAAALLALASLPALAALKPFSADYTASYMGLQGSARMTLAKSGGHQWRYTLDVKSAVAQLSQSTLFEETDGGWRPLSGRDASSVLIKKSDKQASYDWGSGQASWSGDVKPERRGPVALQAGDLDAMLLNLAIVRDVQAGKSSRTYRMVDDGRAKPMSYRVVGKDTVSFDGKSHPATRVSVPDGARETVLWVAEGVPVPVRILRRHKGEDQMDLRLGSID